MAEWLNAVVGYFDSIFHDLYANILVAIVILLIGFVLGKLLGKLALKIMSEIEINKILKKATRLDVNVEGAIGSFVTYFTYFIAIIMALNQLNVTTTILQMLSAAILIVVIISVVLAIKDFIPNMFAGFYIYKNKFLKEGEIIRVKGIEGKVLQINLVETKIETNEGDLVYIPNSALTKTEVIKVSEKAETKKPKKKSKRSIRK